MIIAGISKMPWERVKRRIRFREIFEDAIFSIYPIDKPLNIKFTHVVIPKRKLLEIKRRIKVKLLIKIFTLLLKFQFHEILLTFNIITTKKSH